MRSEARLTPNPIHKVLSTLSTQRDKDWPMLRRLVEAHYATHCAQPSCEQVRFWLREARTPALLVGVAQSYPDYLERALRRRPLLSLARDALVPALEEALAAEERRERERDRLYWEPLRGELEAMRHARVPEVQR